MEMQMTQMTAEFVVELRRALEKQCVGLVVINTCDRCGGISDADPITWEALTSYAIGSPRVAAHLCKCPQECAP